MPVELGQSSIPAQALLEVENPSEDEDNGDEADGSGGAQRDGKLPEMLHGLRVEGATRKTRLKQLFSHHYFKGDGPQSRDQESRQCF